MADLEKKEEKSRQWKPYSCSELSAFCLQVSLLLEAAVPLDEGFSIMAEDAADEKERQMLLYMSEGAELGDPCFKIFLSFSFFLYPIFKMFFCKGRLSLTSSSNDHDHLFFLL